MIWWLSQKIEGGKEQNRKQAFDVQDIFQKSQKHIQVNYIETFSSLLVNKIVH